jgi:hypothetical protein
MKRSPLPFKPKQTTVYHPYYNREISVFSEENCGSTRASLSRFSRLPKAQSILSSLCDILPLDDITYIVGPREYSEYIFGDVTIGIFGEYHALQDISTCTPSFNACTFPAYLVSLLASKPSEFFDVFIETVQSGESSNYVIYEDPMFTLPLTQLMFLNCLTAEKNCPWKNLRMHNIDPRMGVYHHSMELNQLLYNSSNVSLPEKFRNIKSTINYLIITNRLVKKELDKSYLKDVIMDFIFKEIWREIESDTVEYAVNVVAYIMDAYALARMFRQFTPSPDKPTEVKNIIIYAGLTHTRRYQKFLEVVLGLRPVILKRYDTECMHITQSDRLHSKFLG